MGPDGATLPSPGRRTPRRLGPTVRRRSLGGPGRPGGRGGRGLAGPCGRVVGGGRRRWRRRFLPGDRLVVLARPLGAAGVPVRATVVAVADPRDPARVLVKRVASVDRADGHPRGPRATTREPAPTAATFGPVPRDVGARPGRLPLRPWQAGPAPGPGPAGYDRRDASAPWTTSADSSPPTYLDGVDERSLDEIRRCAPSARRPRRRSPTCAA